MINPLNSHDPVLCVSILVVAHPFAVWTLFRKLVGGNKSLQRDLSVSRNGQACQLALDHLDRTAAHASCPIQLALTV